MTTQVPLSACLMVRDLSVLRLINAAWWAFDMFCHLLMCSSGGLDLSSASSESLDFTAVKCSSIKLGSGSSGFLLIRLLYILLHCLW